MKKYNTIIVIILLTFLTALGPITTGLYLPSLPAIQTYFGTDVSTTQLTLSVYLVVFAIAQLFYGPLSDQYGRKPIVLIGTIIYFLGSIICVIAPEIEILIAGRAIQALGGCAGLILARSMVRDIFGQDKTAKILSYMGTAMALAPAIGPVIGGYLTTAYGWQANFKILVVFGGLCFLGIIFLLQETNISKNPQAIHPGHLLKNYMTLLKDRAYLGYLLVISFSYSGMVAFVSGSAFFFIKVLKLQPDIFGYYFALTIVGYMIGTQIGGRMVGRIAIPRIVQYGCLLMAFSGVILLILALIPLNHVAAILLPMTLYMVGLGITFPSALAGVIGPYPKMVGTASSLAGFSQNIIAALVSLWVANHFDMTQFPMAIGIALMAVLASMSHYFLIGKSKALPSSAG